MKYHKQAELNKLLDIYYNGEHKCLSNSQINIELLQSIVNNVIPFEAPDILSITNNTIYAFEHFEFDCYKHNKKGSSFEKESELERNKLLKEYDEKGTQTRSHVIESKGNAILYEENFINIFNNHLNKCPNYIQHIKEGRKENYPISMWFIAEDVNPLGSFFQDNGELRPLVPSMLKNARLCIENSSLSGIIFIYKLPNQSGLYIVKRENLINYRNRIYNSEDIKLECINPQSVSSLIHVN